MPLPVTMPPQPRLATLTTSCAACLTAGESTDAGTGSAAGRDGSSPANTGGDGTPGRTLPPLAEKTGGRGAEREGKRHRAQRPVGWEEVGGGAGREGRAEGPDN